MDPNDLELRKFLVVGIASLCMRLQALHSDKTRRLTISEQLPASYFTAGALSSIRPVRRIMMMNQSSPERKEEQSFDQQRRYNSFNSIRNSYSYSSKMNMGLKIIFKLGLLSIIKSRIAIIDMSILICAYCYTWFLHHSDRIYLLDKALLCSTIYSCMVTDGINIHRVNPTWKNKCRKYVKSSQYQD